MFYMQFHVTEYMPMASKKMWLLLFCSIITLFSSELRFCGCTLLPHPTCEFRHVGHVEISYETKCTKANLTIPDNFNVSALSPSFHVLHLDCPGSSADLQCNVLRNDCQPIPLTQNLVQVILRGLRAEDENQRPPVNRFLTHNKHQIMSLEIEKSKLYYLDKELFRGFLVLKYVSVAECGVHSIALDTFEALTLPDPGVGAERANPLLETIFLHNNALEQLDWSVLRPVRQSLEFLYAGSQTPGLKLLFRSGHEFTLDNLMRLEFSRNALTEVPKEIWQSLKQQGPYGNFYSFTGNNLCNKTDCSCCEIENFARWVKRLSDRGTRVDFSCGIPDKETASHASASLDLGVYANCSKS